MTSFFLEFLQSRDMNLKTSRLAARWALPVAALPSVSPIPSAPLTNLDTNFTNGHESILTGRAKLCDASGERARPYTSSPLQQFVAIGVIRVWSLSVRRYNAVTISSPRKPIPDGC